MRSPVLLFLIGSAGLLASDRPNIIIVITDDQGYGDLGCHGNPIVKTPHLDSFSDDAVSFSNFHVSTTCAPTRGSLMTGRHTNRLNVFHTISGRSLLFEDEGVDERYAYIKAGTPNENPVRITSHDMLTGKHGHMWHQYGAARAVQAAGRWKVEIVEDGAYSISLRRFPRESGLAINARFPAEEKPVRLEEAMPDSRKVEFQEAYLYIADFQNTQKILEGDKEVSFTMKLPAGKFDMEARLMDKDGRIYPSYFVYIEKL
jgi:hypothetical protein